MAQPHRRPFARNRLVGVSIAMLALVAAACGGDDDAGPVPAESESTGESTGDGSEPADDATGESTGDGSEPADDATAESTGDGSETADDATAGEADPAGVGTSKPEVQIPDAVPTELVITDIVEGTGDAAERGDTVQLHYVGVRSSDGVEFDASWDRGTPFDVVVGIGAVIPGFDDGLDGVKLGGRRQIDIPSELAYGTAGAGELIPPDTAITFVVDILSITKPVAVPDERADPSECPAVDGSSPKQQEFDAYPPFCIDVDATYTAEIVTNFGDMTLQLNPAEAPLTVNNFVVLAQYHYFDDTECHRAIPGFVVQCGDPQASGFGGPGYTIPDELPQRPYEIGSIAMANSGTPNSGGSQFFIITGDAGAALPPQYSLFGDVIGGLDTTVSDLDAVANPDDNGQPPLEQIIIESVTITEG